MAAGRKAPETDGDVVVLGSVEHQRQKHGYDLSEHGGRGRSLDAHPGESNQAEDQDGVQNDVDDGAGPLGDHAVDSPPGGL